MIPARGLILLKPVQTAESFAGSSIVLLETTRERWTGFQAEVVAVGEFPFCEEDDCEREHWTNGPGLSKLHHCTLEPGDWVLTEPRQFVELADRQWLAPQDSIIAKIIP